MRNICPHLYARLNVVHTGGVSELLSKARSMHRQDNFLAVATQLFKPCSLALHCHKHPSNQIQVTQLMHSSHKRSSNGPAEASEE